MLDVAALWFSDCPKKCGAEGRKTESQKEIHPILLNLWPEDHLGIYLPM